MSRSQTSDPSVSTSIFAPEHFLIRNDDVAIPMHEAADAIQFVTDFFDALAQDSDNIVLSPSSWMFLSEVLHDKHRMLLKAEARVRAMPSDLLLPHSEEVGLPKIHDLYCARRAREAAEQAAGQ